MKKILNLILFTCLATTAIAQQKPVYERSRTDQVLSDRATQSKAYMAIPSGATPSFPSYVPDSIKKRGSIFFKTADSTVRFWNGVKWVAVLDSIHAKHTYVTLDEVGAPNGVPSLDGGGKVPIAQLPANILIYKGQWDPTTNTPTLVNGTGTVGWVYEASTDGSHNFGAGTIIFKQGDFIIYNGSKWELSGGTDRVTSVNTYQGIVVLNTDDIAEGTINKYFTNTRAATYGDVHYLKLDGSNANSNIDIGASHALSGGAFNSTGGDGSNGSLLGSGLTLNSNTLRDNGTGSGFIMKNGSGNYLKFLSNGSIQRVSDSKFVLFQDDAIVNGTSPYNQNFNLGTGSGTATNLVANGQVVGNSLRSVQTFEVGETTSGTVGINFQSDYSGSVIRNWTMRAGGSAGVINPFIFAYNGSPIYSIAPSGANSFTFNTGIAAGSGASAIVLNNGTQNSIAFGTGSALPTFTTPSIGEKLVLSGGIDATHTNISIGIAPNTMWFGVGNNSASRMFQWYGGTTLAMQLTGAGALSVQGNLTIATLGAGVLATNASGLIGLATNTGTGNNVLSASPTFTGTAVFASGNFTGTVGENFVSNTVYTPTASNAGATIFNVNGPSAPVANNFATYKLQVNGSSGLAGYAGLSLVKPSATSPASDFHLTLRDGGGNFNDVLVVNASGNATFIGSVTATSVNGISAATMAFIDPTSSIQTQLNSKVTNPMTTDGDGIYGGASGLPTRYAGNTTSILKFQTQVSSGAPSYFDLFGTINTWTAQQNMGPIGMTGAGNGIQFNSNSGSIFFSYGSGGIYFQNSTGSFGSFLLASPTSSGSSNPLVYMPTTSGKLALLSDISRKPYTQFTPSSGGTVNMVVNNENIITPAGAIANLTLVFPSTPTDGDTVYLTFSQGVTTITYSGGTIVGGGRVSAVAGDQCHFTAFSGNWY